MKLDLRVDFVRRTRVPVVGVAAAVAAMAVLAWQGLQAQGDFVALEQQRAGLSALSRPAPKAGPAMSPQDIERHAQMEQVAHQLATPWPQLLQLFEKRASADVVLLSLRPDAGDRQLELTGRAKSAQALGAYLESLEKEPMLRDVLMTRHETVADNPSQPVEFAISADWKPAWADAGKGRGPGQ